MRRKIRYLPEIRAMYQSELPPLMVAPLVYSPTHDDIPPQYITHPNHRQHTMPIQTKYNPADKMVSLIADNYQLIQVMSRFGIPMGFGDKTVEKVCSDHGVDCATFLAVVNFIVDGFSNYDTDNNVSVESLLLYLKRSHSYFLDYCLPAIRRKLLEGISLRTTDVSFLILKFFDEYMHEVRIHMEYEEKTVFKYVNNLLSGKSSEDYKITTYSEHHDLVSLKLKELKNIILKYCPEDANTNLLNDALYDIYRCEEELSSHCHIEDCLLVPAILRPERNRN